VSGTRTNLILFEFLSKLGYHWYQTPSPVTFRPLLGQFEYMPQCQMHVSTSWVTSWVAFFASPVPDHYAQIWRHPQSRKYITHCKTPRPYVTCTGNLVKIVCVVPTIYLPTDPHSAIWCQILPLHFVTYGRAQLLLPEHARTHARAHTHTHMFSGLLTRTAQNSRYQKSQTSLDFTEARDSEWQWHQLDHMQVCISR